MEQLTHEQELLKEAFKVALHSQDPSTQNGAFIINEIDNELQVQGVGYNTFPVLVSVTPERLERPLKYDFIEHAERNAIYDAARKGLTTNGGTMVVSWAACVDCARAVIQAGITRVITSKRTYDDSPSRWQESIANALLMFEEAGVEYVLVDGQLGGDPIRFNGEEWTP